MEIQRHIHLGCSGGGFLIITREKQDLWMFLTVASNMVVYIFDKAGRELHAPFHREVEEDGNNQMYAH